MGKNSGMIVTTKDGRTGRTFSDKEWINGKVPVYLCTKSRDTVFTDSRGEKVTHSIPVEYSDKAILCDPKTLTVEGFID